MSRATAFADVLAAAQADCVVTGFLCRDGMRLGQTQVDDETGQRIVPEFLAEASLLPIRCTNSPKSIQSTSSMAVTSHRMTVEELRKLPEDSGPVYHELRHGELVAVTRPKTKHTRIQKHLERLLEQVAGERGVVIMELAFRPVPEYELRVADVAYVNRDRWNSVDPEDHLRGSPDMVIEVLSPSNSAAEIYDKEKLCLENGAQQFWVVDPDRRQVKVSTPDGHTITYQSGQEIPLPLLGGANGAVDAVFA